MLLPNQLFFVDEEKDSAENMSTYIKSCVDKLNNSPDKLFYLYKMIKYLMEL